MRNREEVIRDFVQQWLKKAESDLEAAKVLLKADTGDRFNCVFHCQQAVEKFIKAYLVRHQIEFPKTHDLDVLIALAERIRPSINSEIKACAWLTPYGVEYRYPGTDPEVDENTAKKAVEEVLRIKKVVMAKCGSR